MKINPTRRSKNKSKLDAKSLVSRTPTIRRKRCIDFRATGDCSLCLEVCSSSSHYSSLKYDTAIRNALLHV